MKKLFIAISLVLLMCFPSGAMDDDFYDTGPRSQWTFDAGRNSPLNTRGAQKNTGTFTFAGTNRTYIDADGVMQTAGANVPVYEWVGGKRALRIEPEMANLCLDSRNMDNGSAHWTSSGLSSAAQNSTGVFGDANKATSLTDTNGALIGQISQQISITPNSGPWALTVFLVKNLSPTAYPAVSMYFSGTVAKVAGYCLNPIDGTSTAVTNTAGSVSVIEHGEVVTGFWKYTVIATDNGGNTSVKINLVPAWAETETGTSADSALGVNVFDAVQIEYNKQFPSSYIDNDTIVLGADIASDGDCSGGTLTTGAGWAHDAGNNEYDATASDANLTDAGILTANKVYRLKVVFANDGGGSFIPILGGTSGTAISANGTYYQYIIAGGTDLVFDATGLTGSIQSYEVKEHGTVRLTEEAVLSWALPSGIFDTAGTVICWWRPGFAEANVSSDSSILTVNTASLESAFFHDASANGIASNDATASAAKALAFTINTWYKLAIVFPSDTDKFKIGYDSGSGMSFGPEAAFDGAFTTTGTKITLCLTLQGPMHISKVLIFDRVLTTAQINAIDGSP